MFEVLIVFETFELLSLLRTLWIAYLIVLLHFVVFLAYFHTVLVLQSPTAKPKDKYEGVVWDDVSPTPNLYTLKKAAEAVSDLQVVTSLFVLS